MRAPGRPLLLTLALVLLAVGVTVGIMRSKRSDVDGAGDDAVARCVTLQRWSWEEHGAEAKVRADVTAGAAETLALDARALDAKGQDVFVPVVRTQKLERTPVPRGGTVTVETVLRRVAAGTIHSTLLRISCRPQGPQGTFGAVTYYAGKPPQDEPGPTPRALPPPSTGG